MICHNFDDHIWYKDPSYRFETCARCGTRRGRLPISFVNVPGQDRRAHTIRNPFVIDPDGSCIVSASSLAELAHLSQIRIGDLIMFDKADARPEDAVEVKRVVGVTMLQAGVQLRLVDHGETLS
jgi:phosphoribosylformylglycinamidine (FGAM) synthase PurS component